MNRSARSLLAPIVILTAAAMLAACGGSATPGASAVAAKISALAASVPAPAAPTTTVAMGTAAVGTAAASSVVMGTAAMGTATAAPVMDPCTKLTKADVQPFFTVPVVTELPDSWDTATTKGCEFSAAGIAGTTLGIKVVSGDDAQTMALLQKSDTEEVQFSGVGSGAEHPHGSTEFTAQEGTTAAPEYCGISTTGWKELAGKKDVADATQIPDATATTIAQQYGTLCNKLFGSGDATPTMTVAPPAASAVAAASAGSLPSGPILATGGSIGSGFPTPAGLDCTGSKTTTDSEGNISCYTTTKDGKAVYDYYLSVLPTKGYTINHEGLQSGTTGAVASILFTGPGAGGFSNLSIVGPNVTITLQKG